MEEIPKTKMGSFAWGLIAYFIGAIVGFFIPLGGIFFAIVFYWFYLRKRHVHLMWYVFGFAFLYVIALIFIGTLVGIWLFGGGS